MVVRIATEQDIEEVREIIGNLQVTREQEGWQEAQSGFFEYPKSVEVLTKSLNPYFLVAQSTDRIEGFSLAYDDKFFRQAFGNTDWPEWRHLLDNESENFLYIDLLGVRESGTLKGSRIAKELYEETINSGKDSGVQRAFGYVCEKPIVNEVSTRFARRRGFEKRAAIDIGEGVTLGLWELDLGKV